MHIGFRWKAYDSHPVSGRYQVSDVFLRWEVERGMLGEGNPSVLMTWLFCTERNDHFPHDDALPTERGCAGLVHKVGLVGLSARGARSDPVRCIIVRS